MCQGQGTTQLKWTWEETEYLYVGSTNLSIGFIPHLKPAWDRKVSVHLFSLVEWEDWIV